jgi:hypothetical protein
VVVLGRCGLTDTQDEATEEADRIDGDEAQRDIAAGDREGARPDRVVHAFCHVVLVPLLLMSVACHERTIPFAVQVLVGEWLIFLHRGFGIEWVERIVHAVPVHVVEGFHPHLPRAIRLQVARDDIVNACTHAQPTGAVGRHVDGLLRERCLGRKESVLDGRIKARLRREWDEK